MAITHPERTDVRWRHWFPELGTDREVAELFDRLALDDAPYAGASEPLSAPTDDLDRWVPADVDPLDRFLVALVSPSVRRLESALAGHPRVAAPDALLREQLEQLVRVVREPALRPLISLLHERSAAGLLAGATPEERYASFAAELHTPARLDELQARFPGLPTLLRSLAARRVDVVLEVLDHLDQDAADLATRLLGSEPLAPVRSLSIGAGDGHRGGRSVSTLELADGRRLVYKPRSLHVDVAFGRVLDVVRRGTGEALPTPRVLARDDHGWVEHVTHRMPAGATEEQSYYRGLGVLTGLFHLLGATDMHFENVIAVGPDPVVVDLETLLHPRLTPPESYDADAGTHHALEALSRSVCAVGLLPLVMARGNQPDSESIDVGASGFEPDALSPFRSLSVRNRRRDDMHVVLERLPLATSSSTPTLVVDEPGTPRQVRALLDGFEHLHRWVEGHAEELADLVDDAFAGTRTRYIHQPTYFYAQMVRLGTNPEVLADPAAREVVMRRVGLRMPDAPADVTRAEVRDLVEHDIPLFTADPASRSLFTSRGEEIPDVLEEAPLATARQRILGADEESRREQVDLIRLAFINKYDDDPTSSYLDGAPATSTSTRADLLDTARRIGDRLLETRHDSTSPRFPTTWLGPLVSVTSSRLWRLGALQYDLYGGVPGVATYLAQLAATTGEQAYGDVALSVVEPLTDQLDDLVEHGLAGSPGAWTGFGGTLYAILRVGTALGRDDLVDAARDHGGALVDIAARAEQCDVTGGRAGALSTLLTLAAGAPARQREPLLDHAVAVADGLLATHPLLGDGDPGVFHSGFAHGTAGIHPHLARLAAERPDAADRLTTAADRLVAAEDSLWSANDANWWTSSEHTNQSSAWCHGASGILLGRLLRIRAGAGDAGDDLAVRRALTVVRERGLGHNLGHCHGDAGNLEVLRLAAEVLDDHDLADFTARATDVLHDRVIRGCDVEPADKYALSSSLMLGTSGAGWALLRRLEPRETPAFLWLD